MQDRYTDRLSDYIDDEDLDPREREEIEAHLKACS
jgi:anti-sigma factor RsiW